MKCPECGRSVPLVEAGEHELTCDAVELHPFDLVGRKDESDVIRAGTSKKPSTRGTEKPASAAS